MTGDMRAALEALVTRLELCHADPDYISVWTISQLHVGPYTGPTYEAELINAKAALASDAAQAAAGAGGDGPAKIFLDPVCEQYAEGRCWSTDRHDCEDCDAKAVEYIRADLASPKSVPPEAGVVTKDILDDFDPRKHRPASDLVDAPLSAPPDAAGAGWRDALAPFARAAEAFDSWPNSVPKDSANICTFIPHGGTLEDGAEINHGHCRAARVALSAAPAAPSAPPSAGEWQPTHRHLKRGTTYREVARGFAQVAAHPIEEMTAVTIYQGKDGVYWVRNAVEFDDGRFAALSRAGGKPGEG